MITIALVASTFEKTAKMFKIDDLIIQKIINGEEWKVLATNSLLLRDGAAYLEYLPMIKFLIVNHFY